MMSGAPLLSDGTVTLRAVEPSDLELFMIWENDTRLWDSGPTVAPLSQRIMADYIASYNADIYAERQLRLTVTLSDTGAAVGTLDLFEFDPVSGRAGIGVLIDEAYSGRGLGRRALTLAIGYCRRRLAMNQIWAIAGSDNAPSLAMLDSCGFERVGILRRWMRRTDGTLADAVMLQLLL